MPTIGRLMTTLPAEIAALLPALVDDLRSALGNEFVGIYLYGSAIAGGFDAAASDLDVAVVVARPTDEIDLDVLGGIVERLGLREPTWADRLDIVFVSRSTLATFRDGGPLVSISHDEPLQRYDDADTWLQTWFLVRTADANVIGPPIRDVIPEIGLDEFIAAVTSDAGRIVRRAMAEDVWDGLLAYTLLTVARVARVRETGEIIPKDDAGRWLASHRPRDAAVIETAVLVRHGGEPGEAWRAGVRRLLSEIVPFET
jgi:hypothetical protein